MLCKNCLGIGDNEMTDGKVIDGGQIITCKCEV